MEVAIMKNAEEWVIREIMDFIRVSDDNRLRKLDNSIMFEEPLVGFTSGTDPLFLDLKEVIGAFHLTPHEVMERCCSADGLRVPEESEVGVISYVLPITAPTRFENAFMSDGPSERWSHTRLFGEMFNRKLQAHLASRLVEKGLVAFAPELEEGIFSTIEDEKVGRASTWSQRHVAFACGLGTFGISDGLITARGKAHRLGSVVVNRSFPSPDREDDIHAGCIHFQNGGCMACAKRCPAGAITEAGHDKERCAEFLYGQAASIKEKYGIDIYTCGLCQTGVPCEHRDPVHGR